MRNSKLMSCQGRVITSHQLQCLCKLFPRSPSTFSLNSMNSVITSPRLQPQPSTSPSSLTTLSSFERLIPSETGSSERPRSSPSEAARTNKTLACLQLPDNGCEPSVSIVLVYHVLERPLKGSHEALTLTDIFFRVPYHIYTHSRSHWHL